MFLCFHSISFHTAYCPAHDTNLCSPAGFTVCFDKITLSLLLQVSVLWKSVSLEIYMQYERASFCSVSVT